MRMNRILQSRVYMYKSLHWKRNLLNRLCMMSQSLHWKIGQLGMASRKALLNRIHKGKMLELVKELDLG